MSLVYLMIIRRYQWCFAGPIQAQLYEECAVLARSGHLRITGQELNPGDRVDGLDDFGKPNGEFDTVKQANEDDAVVIMGSRQSDETASTVAQEGLARYTARSIREVLGQSSTVSELPLSKLPPFQLPWTHRYSPAAIDAAPSGPCVLANTARRRNTG
jgi:hypothetical protein